MSCSEFVGGQATTLGMDLGCMIFGWIHFLLNMKQFHFAKDMSYPMSSKSKTDEESFSDIISYADWVAIVEKARILQPNIFCVSKEEYDRLRERFEKLKKKP